MPCYARQCDLAPGDDVSKAMIPQAADQAFGDSSDIRSSHMAGSYRWKANASRFSQVHILSTKSCNGVLFESFAECRDRRNEGSKPPRFYHPTSAHGTSA
jgi:hypothetical protein